MSNWSRAIYHRQNNRYYKYQETQQGPDILDGNSEKALEKGNPAFHDHFFKRNGVWYVQSKINNEHLFKELKPGVKGVEQIEAGEYLDALLKELKELD